MGLFLLQFPGRMLQAYLAKATPYCGLSGGQSKITLIALIRCVVRQAACAAGPLEKNMAKAAKFPTSFGVFSPTGHIVMVFSTEENAKKAERALLAGGFSRDDLTLYRHEDVVLELEKSERQAANPVQIGQDVAKMPEYLALAKEGCGFLVVHAPEEEQTKRAIDVARPYGLRFAEKYNRLTLEELA